MILPVVTINFVNTIHVCPSATCSNVDGSFECGCNSGFEGSGETCADVDESDLLIANTPLFRMEDYLIDFLKPKDVILCRIF